MGLFDAIEIAGSGLTAQRVRMDVTSENIANAQTTRDANGQPYRRQEVVLQQIRPSSFSTTLAGAVANGSAPPAPGGVQVGAVLSDSTPDQRVYDPSSPDANAQGYVQLPNVNTVTEMTDLIAESHSYQSDVTAMQTAKSMFSSLMGLLK
jgi:flagellar basal-body rod protein FlgC